MDTKGPKTAESESKENNNTRTDPTMTSVQKDNFYPHKVEKLGNVPQLNLDKSPTEKSTPYLNQQQTASVCKWHSAGECAEQLSASEPSPVTQAPKQLSNANIDQSPPTDGRSDTDHEEDRDNQQFLTPVKLANAKQTVGAGQARSNCKCSASSQCGEDCTGCQPEEADVIPESPLSDAGAEDIGTGSKNDNRLTGQERGLGDSPPFEKESEPESPMDVDNSNTSRQDSEADEDASPVCDEQGDRSSQTAHKLPSCQARELDGDLRKRYLTKGSEIRLHFQFEGESSAGTSDLNAKPSGNSSSLNVDCRSSKQHGKRDSKITDHFVRIPKSEDKRKEQCEVRHQRAERKIPQ